jgi:uncharacterized protein YdiU (UPF0061 family)
VNKFFEVLESTGADFTDSFRLLANVNTSNQEYLAELTEQFCTISATPKFLSKKNEPMFPPAVIEKIRGILD